MNYTDQNEDKKNDSDKRKKICLKQRIRKEKEQLKTLLKQYKNLVFKTSRVLKKIQQVRENLEDCDLILCGIVWDRPITSELVPLSPTSANVHFKVIKNLLKANINEFEKAVADINTIVKYEF